MKQIFIAICCLFSISASLCAQTSDTRLSTTDSIRLSPAIDSAGTLIDTLIKKADTQGKVFRLNNKLLNDSAEPVSFAVEFRKSRNRDFLFYLVTGMILMLALFKFFNHRYFVNLFRVFFNTSLRQSQLTDQLLQARLPSLLFNLFFVVSAGVYAYLLLQYYGLVSGIDSRILIASSVLLLSIIFLGKYSILKFTGWLTGYKEATNTYIFVIFLINKIIGVFLVPFTVIIAFSGPGAAEIASLLSVMSIGIFLLLRFFRSYGLIQNQLKISRYHFVLYIVGIEILPLLLIYRGLMLYLSKNL